MRLFKKPKTKTPEFEHGTCHIFAITLTPSNEPITSYQVTVKVTWNAPPMYCQINNITTTLQRVADATKYSMVERPEGLLMYWGALTAVLNSEIVRVKHVFLEIGGGVVRSFTVK